MYLYSLTGDFASYSGCFYWNTTCWSGIGAVTIGGRPVPIAIRRVLIGAPPTLIKTGWTRLRIRPEPIRPAPMPIGIDPRPCLFGSIPVIIRRIPTITGGLPIGTEHQPSSFRANPDKTRRKPIKTDCIADKAQGIAIKWLWSLVKTLTVLKVSHNSPVKTHHFYRLSRSKRILRVAKLESNR